MGLRTVPRAEARNFVTVPHGFDHIEYSKHVPPESHIYAVDSGHRITSVADTAIPNPGKLIDVTEESGRQ